MANVESEIGCSRWRRWKPFILVTLLQIGLAGMDVLSKAALNQGMSNYVLVAYCHAFAALVFAPFALVFDRKVRPRMTRSVFFQIVVLSILEPVIEQNLYFLGMKYTTATFAAALYNTLPAVTFLIASLVGLEKVRMKSIRTQAKVIGTVASVVGAIVMVLVNKGPVVELPWTKGRRFHGQGATMTNDGVDLRSYVKGSLMIMASSFSSAGFVILQAITIRKYPAELSLTALVCVMGTIGASVVAVVMERGNPRAWILHWDTKLLATAYNGVVCAGLTYYIQWVVMKNRGPVFVTAFSPLCMVAVAILSSVIFAEQMFLGRVVGAAVIVAGLYFVVWGKTKDHHIMECADEQQQAIPITRMSNGLIRGHQHRDPVTIVASSSEDVQVQDKSSIEQTSLNQTSV